MSYRRGYYKKEGTSVQGHFTNTRSKTYKYKKSKGCAVLLLLLITFSGVISCSGSDGCESKKCSDFSSQAEAQSTFDSDRDCYKNLDTDNDLIPCENLPN